MVWSPLDVSQAKSEALKRQKSMFISLFAGLSLSQAPVMFLARQGLLSLRRWLRVAVLAFFYWKSQQRHSLRPTRILQTNVATHYDGQVYDGVLLCVDDVQDCGPV